MQPNDSLAPRVIIPSLLSLPLIPFLPFFSAMQLLLFSSSFHFTQATLFPSFATFTLHRPPLSHASPLLCGNLSHFGSAAPSSIALHNLFDSKILLLPFLAGSPACRSSGSLVAHLKEEKARMMRIAVKAPNPNIKGLKINSAMSCQFDSTKRRPMHQNCLACAQSATKKKPKRTES